MKWIELSTFWKTESNIQRRGCCCCCYLVMFFTVTACGWSWTENDNFSFIYLLDIANCEFFCHHSHFRFPDSGLPRSVAFRSLKTTKAKKNIACRYAILDWGPIWSGSKPHIGKRQKQLSESERGDGFAILPEFWNLKSENSWVRHTKLSESESENSDSIIGKKNFR